MRRIALVIALGGALGLGACGDAPAPAGPEPRVRVELTSPADGGVVRADRVRVHGTVSPAGAQVQVLGRDVAVQDGGDFTAQVALQPGANLVDVAASAHDRRGGFAVLRVVREVRVAVPALDGRDADAARAELERLGLAVALEDGGGFLDPILPGDPSVCRTDPEAGAFLRPGTRVTVVVARDC